MKRPTDLLISVRRFSPSQKFLHQFSAFFCSRRFPPIRSPFYVKLSWGLNYPSPFWLEKLHPDGKALALQRLAVSYSGRGAKVSGTRGERQFLALFPAAHTHHSSAAGAHVFRKCRFRTGHLAMPVNEYGNLHQDAVFSPVKRKFIPERHGRCSSSQARGNSREILHAAGSAPVFHGIEGAVRGTK